MSAQRRSRGALHEDLARAPEVKAGSDRSFGLVFVAVFLVIALWPVFGSGNVRWWALAVAAVLAAVTLARAALLAPLNRLWFRFGLLLGRVTTPLVLGLIFFGVVWPTAVLMRITGRDVLRLRSGREHAGWIERKEVANRGNQMRQQF